MKDKFKTFYLDIAKRAAQLSYAKRLKVGCVIVRDHHVLGVSYNGMPIGWDNECEVTKTDFDGNEYLKTKPELIHAEMNGILRLARSNESGIGAAMFCTHSPCIECSKGIFMSGIEEFYYEQEYRSREGISFLEKCGVKVEKIS